MIKIKFSDEEINFLKANYIVFNKLKKENDFFELENSQLEDIKSWAIFNRAISQNEEDRIILKIILDTCKKELEKQREKLEKKWGFIFSLVLPVLSLIGFLFNHSKNINPFIYALNIGCFINLFLSGLFLFVFLFTKRGKTFYLYFAIGTALIFILNAIIYLLMMVLR